MNIKAIETPYKGYRLRSRTEARWAVLFDFIKLEWRYEKEGYGIPEYGGYLPDFFMPKQPMLIVDCLVVEIKAEEPTIIEKKRAHAISEGLHTPVLMLYDTPGDHGWILYYEEYYFDSKKYGRDKWYSFAGIRSNDRLIHLGYSEARSARFEHGERK